MWFSLRDTQPLCGFGADFENQFVNLAEHGVEPCVI